MKLISALIAVFLMLIDPPCAFSQGFVNLNFEVTALPTNGAPSTVLTTIGLPGWIASIGGVDQTTILYNNGTLGSSDIAILGSGNSVNPVIAGDFSVSLTAGFGGNAAISQTGSVPAGMNSLLFEDYSEGNGVPNLSVTLDGQAINVWPITTTAQYTLYGGDISAFAGQTADLAFTAISDYPQGFEIFTLDQISFATNPVPEPGEFALAALGGLLFGWSRWLKSARCHRDQPLRSWLMSGVASRRSAGLSEVLPIINVEEPCNS